MTKKILKTIEEFVDINPEIRGGEPVFKGTRIPVGYVVEHFEKGWTTNDVIDLFPELNSELIIKISNTIFETHTNDQREEIKIAWLSYT
jgi:uncharacterized protein (DUF433 family)